MRVLVPILAWLLCAGCSPGEAEADLGARAGVPYGAASGSTAGPEAPSLPGTARRPAPAPSGDARKPAPSPSNEPGDGLVTIAAVGDVIPHIRVKAMARQSDRVDGEGRSQNHRGYAAVFDPTLPAFAEADIGFANLETPVSKSGRNKGFKVFNGPPALLDAMKAANITVVSFANNHVYDQSRRGFGETLAELRARGLVTLGAGFSEAEAWAPRAVEREGLKVCFMGATRLLNGNLQPKTADKPQVLYIPYGRGEKAAKKRVLEQVVAVRPQCDYLLLSIHWGVEYDTVPHESDVSLAKALLEAGVDGILGHHPHVLQPLVRRKAKDGRDTFVAYSMGNFVASMSKSRVTWAEPKRAGAPRDSMVLRVTVGRNESGRGPKGVLHGLEYLPAWADRTPRPDEKVSRDARIIRPVLIDHEVARAREALKALAALPSPGKREQAARRQWQARIRELEARRREILRVVGPAHAAAPAEAVARTAGQSRPIE